MRPECTRKQVFARADLRLESKDYTKKTFIGWDPDSVESDGHIEGGDEYDDDGDESDLDDSGSTLTAIPGLWGKGRERMGQRIVCRHLRQRRIHQRVETSMPTHQKKRARMPTVRVSPRWRELVAWHVCSTQGRISIST